MTDERLEERLENWAAWCRANPHKSHCFSIEHRYTPPPCWDSQQPRREIDILDAAVIEKLVIRLPDQAKAALKYGVVLPWVPFWEQVRRIACKGHTYKETIKRAKTMLKNVLDKLESNVYK